MGQDTSSYGRDLHSKDGLAKLLQTLDKIEDLAWIRLLYLYPTGFSDRLIKTIRASKRICPYLDIPIQHAHDAILEQDGLTLYVDAVALSFLSGVEIDFVEQGMGASFVFKNAFASTGGSGACSACGAAGGGCA